MAGSGVGSQLATRPPQAQWERKWLRSMFRAKVGGSGRKAENCKADPLQK